MCLFILSSYRVVFLVRCWKVCYCHMGGWRMDGGRWCSGMEKQDVALFPPLLLMTNVMWLSEDVGSWTWRVVLSWTWTHEQLHRPRILEDVSCLRTAGGSEVQLHHLLQELIVSKNVNDTWVVVGSLKTGPTFPSIIKTIHIYRMLSYMKFTFSTSHCSTA